MKKENLLILYTVYVLHKKYHFTFASENLINFLEGRVFSTVKRFHLFMLPMYGALRHSDCDVGTVVEQLIEEKFLNENYYSNKHHRKVLSISKEGIEFIQRNLRSVDNILIETFHSHFNTLRDKGVKYLNFPKEKTHNCNNKMKLIQYPNHGKPWDEEQRKEVVEMYKSGLEIKSISKLKGRSLGSIWSILHNAKLLDDDTYANFVKDIDVINIESIQRNQFNIVSNEIEKDLFSSVEIWGGNGLSEEEAIETSYPGDEEVEMEIISSFLKILHIENPSLDLGYLHNEKTDKSFDVITVDSETKYYFNVTDAEEGIQVDDEGYPITNTIGFYPEEQEIEVVVKEYPNNEDIDEDYPTGEEDIDKYQ